MTDLEQLIETTYRLSNTLSQIAGNEIHDCEQLSLKLEHMSWQSLCLANEMKDIKNQYLGDNYVV